MQKEGTELLLDTVVDESSIREITADELMRISGGVVASNQAPTAHTDVWVAYT